jgi:SAM-dependent methyltransferase
LPPSYRDFYYPLNVFMHILTREEGAVRHLHYGLFERPEEPIAEAQERSTDLLLSRLAPPPARLLEAGAGLGATLERLAALGYDAEGITPDPKQVAAARGRVSLASFETFDGGPYDVILFQESSQYIDSGALFAKARALAPRVLVLDEFATVPLDEEGALRTRDSFLAAAEANAFRLAEELDLSAKAAPTIDYFRIRIPRHRQALIDDLGLTGQQVDDLIAGGERYRERYQSGVYVYRLMDFVR